jgi:hypothetical protein
MSSLNWKGDEVKRIMKEHGAEIISEFALTVEGEAKKELVRGHGVLTGTLRRSIHAAQPGYDWSQDAAKVQLTGKREKGSSFTLGGETVMPSIDGSKITVEIGSGLDYAMAVHQGHHSFAGYHYLTNGLKKATEKLPRIISKFRMQK